MSACATTMVVMATILGPITLVFMSVSFGTNYWLEYTVDTSVFNSTIKARTKTDPAFARYHLTRVRGLFRECYPNNETEFLDIATGVIDSYCFKINYDMPSAVSNPSESYMTRLHLNRSFLAFFIISIVLYVIAYIFGLVLCCLRKPRWAYVAGIISYSSGFFLAAAIAFFHGAEYIERNKLNRGPSSIEAPFFASWPQYLKDATNREYGWSYPLAWVGMILATIAGTFYSVAGCYIASERYEDEEVLHKKRPRDYGAPMAPVYAIGADPYYTKHYGYPRAFLGPLAPEYYARNYPAIGYGEPRSDIWHWREVES